MSDREKIYQLLDTVPDDKIAYIIGYIQGLTIDNSEEPNEETIAAMEESEEMLKNGSGQRFEGSTKTFPNRRTIGKACKSIDNNIW